MRPTFMFMKVRPILLSEKTVVEDRYHAYFAYPYTGHNAPHPKPNTNIITNVESLSIQYAPMQYHVAGFRNPDDHIDAVHFLNYFNSASFSRKTGMVLHQALMEKRCLFPANCLMVWSGHGLAQPYLLYAPGQAFFSVGGVWQLVAGPDGQLLLQATIIGQPASPLYQQMGLSTMPLILHRSQEKVWLQQQVAYRDISAMLRTAYPQKLLNAYPLPPDTASQAIESKQQLKPNGQRLRREEALEVHYDLKLEGMGGSRRRRRPGNHQETA